MARTLAPPATTAPPVAAPTAPPRPRRHGPGGTGPAGADATGAPGRRGGFRLGHRPALDGVRALAIAAVMGFHAGTAAVPGGYFGVDVFFTLSGFLITALLVEEWRAAGGVRLGAFYARRALRLLPALALLLAGAAAYAAARPGLPEVATMPRDLIATTFYAANWALALAPHYETRLLSHTWSLGVEEQFYLLWPVLLTGLLAALGLRRRRGTDAGRRYLLAAALVAGAAAASCAERWLLWRAGTPGPRISWGTDTRASALLVGCALALACAGGALPRSRPGRAMAQAAGWVGLGWLVFVFVGPRYRLAAIAADPARNFVEGMTVVAVAAALLLVGVLAAPGGPLARLLALRPVVWVGRVSYGLYLFHFPIFSAVTPEATGWPGPAVLASRMALTLGITVASWRLVEQPFLRLKRSFEVAR